jgi:predicted TIM-barrel fold metal-dependent hydrolase
MTTRRAILRGGVALISSAMLPAMAATSLQIDVHHHFSPPLLRDFYERLNRSGHNVAAPPMSWDLQRDLDDMDRGGTRLALLSSFTPYDVGTPAERARLARQLNDYGAGLCARHPQRFALLATLPMPAIDESLTEIAYAFDVLHAKGVIVYSSTGDRWFSDPSFAPVHDELNRRGAAVFVHPNTANCCHNLVAGVPDNIVEYGTDTTRVIAGLVFGGVTTQYRNIRFIFAHGGGSMPFLIERFLGGTSAEIVPGTVTHGQAPPYTPKQPPAGALAELRRMYYDTAQCSNPAALGALKTVIAPTNILFGTDYWYRSAKESRDGLAGSAVFSKSELQSIFTGNALRLWPDLSA